MFSELKKRIRRKELTVGTWLTIGQVSVLENMAAAGFDWVVFDIEHSLMSTSELSALIGLSWAMKFPVLVRLTSNNPDQAKRVLDAGAAGVVVPMINNGEDLRRAVDAVKYPPIGKRGFGLARAQGYGDQFQEYVSSINSESIVVAQVEHIDAINNLDAILSHPELDATIIGPYDLSGSLGVPGRFDDPAVVTALETYERHAPRHQAAMGYHIVKTSEEEFKSRVNRGYRFIAYGVDFIFLRSACADALVRARRSIA